MIDLNKYVVTGDIGNPLHSSGYANIANPGRIGSVGASSFNDRQAGEHNRQVVGSYNRSLIGHGYSVLRASAVAPGGSNRTVERSRSSLDQTTATPASAPRGFVEPPSRTYNPYS